MSRPASTRFRSLLGLLVALVGGPALGEEPLAAVLARLVEGGTPLVYSSELVRPEMRVSGGRALESLPAEEIAVALGELLRPLGLSIEQGPGHSLLVVSILPAPMAVVFTSPEPSVPAGEPVAVRVEVESTEPIERVEIRLDGKEVARLLAPPWEVELEQGAGPRQRELEAEAFGTHGGRGRAMLTFRALAVEARIEVAERLVAVSARRDGRGVVGLPRSAFSLTVNGTPRALSSFTTTRGPAAVVLLLDASESMSGSRFERAVAAARSVIFAKQPADEVAVIGFSDRVQQWSRLRASPEAGLAVLAGARPAGLTALNDHLLLGLRLASAAEGRPAEGRPAEGRPAEGRPAIVVLSDGAEVVSVLDVGQVAELVLRAGVAVHWWRVPGRSPGVAAVSSAWRDAEATRRQWEGLGALVDRSGGRVTDLDRESPDAAAASLWRDLGHRYLLGYRWPSARDPEAVEARVDDPTVSVRVDRSWSKDSPSIDPLTGE